ncbi:hypothetical protein B0T19DRAFT_459729 [Cercophora scortea]|uniref:Uncharacterized protein n=1 Tax=Cercophora scortea TaxID=314031 RepID=A0AAE0IZK0_9PEZI|nr:hypothetical protein B0T19DRAFT_459729 [Cercophora scortea]
MNNYYPTGVLIPCPRPSFPMRRTSTFSPFNQLHVATLHLNQASPPTPTLKRIKSISVPLQTTTMTATRYVIYSRNQKPINTEKTLRDNCDAVQPLIQRILDRESLDPGKAQLLYISVGHRLWVAFDYDNPDHVECAVGIRLSPPAKSPKAEPTKETTSSDAPTPSAQTDPVDDDGDTAKEKDREEDDGDAAEVKEQGDDDGDNAGDEERGQQHDDADTAKEKETVLSIDTD